MSKTKQAPPPRREHETQSLKASDRPADSQFPDEPPADMDEFRRMLARRIAVFIGNRQKSWRSCPEFCCRRQRACVAPRIHCSNAPPAPPYAPEEWSRTSALVQRTLREVLARRGGGE